MKNLLMALLLLTFSTLASTSTKVPLELQNKTISIIVPTAPGGTVDILARQIIARIEQNTGLNMVVQNKTGANGLIALNHLIRAPIDGKTLLLADMGLPILSSIRGESDASNNISTISAGIEVYPILMVSSSAPYDTFPEFIDYISRNSSNCNYATVGMSTSLLTEHLLDVAQVPFCQAISYRGGAAMVSSVMSKEATFVLYSDFASHTNNSKIKFLVAGSKDRLYKLKETPAISEYIKNTKLHIQVSLFSHKELPKHLQEFFNEEWNKAMLEKEQMAIFDNTGRLPVPISLDKANALYKLEYEKTDLIYKKLKNKLDSK
jgi:tripartite-type tricarboxylate transporter receptor subunit TctC